MRQKCRAFKALFLYDLNYGFQRNRIKWLFALLIQIYFCILAGQMGSVYETDMGFFERLTFLFKGITEYHLSETSEFELPAQWLFFHGYLLFMVDFYLVHELTHNGGQTFIRSGGRECWLFSKLMWVISNVVSYYLLLAIIVGICSLSANGFSTDNFWISSDAMLKIFGINLTGLSFVDIFFYWWGMPLLVSLALCITEVIISLFIQPILSFFLMSAYLIASVFWMKPIFLGNYSMLLRQEFISGNLSISLQNCLSGCILLITIAITVGMLCFKNRDIFPQQEGE